MSAQWTVFVPMTEEKSLCNFPTIVNTWLY